MAPDAETWGSTFRGPRSVQDLALRAGDPLRPGHAFSPPLESRVGSGPRGGGKTVKGHAQQHLGGQAPDQAGDSNRDRAATNERTSHCQITKAWGHTRSQRDQPSTVIRPKRDPHSQVSPGPAPPAQKVTGNSLLPNGVAQEANGGEVAPLTALHEPTR